MAAVDMAADVPMSPHTLTVRPTEQGSALGLRLELGGRPLFGPVGSAAARAVKGDVEKSLKQFVKLYG